jgi:hypothetical protein
MDHRWYNRYKSPGESSQLMDIFIEYTSQNAHLRSYRARRLVASLVHGKPTEQQ